MFPVLSLNPSGLRLLSAKHSQSNFRVGEVLAPMDNVTDVDRIDKKRWIGVIKEDCKELDMTTRDAYEIAYNEGLAVASIARDVGSSSTNRSSDIMH